MYHPLEVYFLLYYYFIEQRENHTRETEYQQLPQAAGLQNSSLKRYRKAIRWLGEHMVKWGTKLQSYDRPDQGSQETPLKIPL
jgi:hypothetical protein